MDEHGIEPLGTSPSPEKEITSNYGMQLPVFPFIILISQTDLVLRQKELWRQGH